MKNFIWIILVALFAITFSACNETATNTNSNTGNTNTAAETDKEKSETELKSAIVALENTAHKAVQDKNGKFFEGFLTEGFVGLGRNGRGGKAVVPKAISESKCESKDFSVSDEEVTLLGEGVALMTSKFTSDNSCDGKATPSPNWTATVYIKDGDNWKAAYHQSAPTADAKGENPSPTADAPKPKPMEDADKELTATLSAIDKSLTEAWTKKDTKPFEETLAENFTVLNPGGWENRAEALKNIGEHKCEVKSYSLSDFHTSKISDNIFLLTYKATTEGTCDGKPIPKGSWVSSVFMKDGDKWKGLFHMSTASA